MKKSVSLDFLARNGVWHWRSGFSARLVPGLQISSCSQCWIGLFGGVERICRPWRWSEWNPKFHEQVLVEAGHCLNLPSSRTYLLKASLNVWIQQLPIAEGFTWPQVLLSRFWDLSSSGPRWLCGFVFKGPQEMPFGSSSPNSGLYLGLGAESWMLFSSAEPCSSRCFWWMLLLWVSTGQL